MAGQRWRFSIDVGGTFTDCIAASPDGKTHRLKLLSTGRIRSEAVVENHQLRLRLPFKVADDVLIGFTCRLYDNHHRLLFEAKVAGWEEASQTLRLDQSGSISEVCSVELDASQPAPAVAVRILTATPLSRQAEQIDLRLGTTRGTNALLTRTGADTALITTRGFKDALTIGTQQRPELFALEVKRGDTLPSMVVELDERVDHLGNVLCALDEEQVRQTLAELTQSSVTSLAISFLHSYKNPVHELRVAELAREAGFDQVSLSHQTSPLVKFIPRANTAVLDAYLNPVLQTYIAEIQKQLGSGCSLLLMTSSGGLVEPTDFSGKDSILSGPAGGAVGFAKAAEQAGFQKAIGFDMGGTSTDVSRLDGQLGLQNETRKAGIDIQTPVLAIETVAAGGGSICSYAGGRLQVGPQSAGADPGPACYGRGGPLTVTDLNVYLGRVSPDRFPFPLDFPAIEQRLRSLRDQVTTDSRVGYTLDQLVVALLEIANSHMASAVNTVTTRQGEDPADYLLVGFGGAAGQHVCGVADCLGIRRILLHPDAGILSAFGISQAPLRVSRQLSLLQKLDDTSVRQLAETVRENLDQMTRSVDAGLPLRTLIRVQLCVRGTQQILSQLLDANAPQDWTASEILRRFWEQFEIRFGYRQNRDVDLQDVLLELQVGNGWTSAASENRVSNSSTQDNQKPGVWMRENLGPGHVVLGPAVITEPHATTFVADNWQAELLPDGQLLLERVIVQRADPASEDGVEQSRQAVASATERDHRDDDLEKCQPHRLELFHHRLTDIATQMGTMLQSTCTSVNVKERLDFSCAVFDAEGQLLVNAPHIPVHLGAMSETVQQTMRCNHRIQEGDHFVTNDPFLGGSHLPDVTVISPVFLPEMEKPAFWVASRAHHAEIGGLTPGSMPPFSKTLEEEGIRLSNIRIRETDIDPFQQIAGELSSGRFPSRNVQDNLLDLQAQLAANRKGVQLLRELAGQWTWPVVSRYTQFVLETAAAHVTELLSRLPKGSRQFEDQLDCGLTIRLSLEIRSDRLVLDFSGTDQPMGNNFNTNSAIVRSAVLYCLRLMLDSQLPLNDGVLRPVEIQLPRCFLNPIPEHASSQAEASQLPAVVGGNVETSQRVVDVILGAFGITAASQGTMNNFLFGDATFGFYETIGGGTGATARRPGADAVHSHMTNTRLTDPEILERRYPVRLMEFAIRAGSGGVGNHHGGNGMIRRFQFLRQLTVSLLTNRRGQKAELQPYGMEGGGPGLPGENWLIKTDGSRELLPASCQVEVEAGQQVEIRTPGGGAWGREE